MKLRLQFGLSEPPREVSWWQKIQDFPSLVDYKGLKWEFIVYGDDPTKQVDYICNFSEVPTYDPNYSATTYVNIDHLLNAGYGSCTCGAIYSSFPWAHMLYCFKWKKWEDI